MAQVRALRYDNALIRELRTGETLRPEDLGSGTPDATKVLWGDGVWRTPYYLKSTVSTTTAATTTIQTIPIATGQGVLIIAHVLSKKTGGAGVGTTCDVNAYVRTVKVKNVGGTVTIGSISADFTSEDIAAFNATFSISGTNILVEVSGAINDNVDWTATTDIYTN